MSRTSAAEYGPYVPPGGLGVMDAVRLGWDLFRKDFWPIWVVGLVAYIILFGVNMVGGIVGIVPIVGPLVNGCLTLAVGIFVQPALTAGLFYAIRRKIDGAPVQVNDLFEGFRQRYWQSVVAVLPPIVISIVGVLFIGVIVLGVLALGFHVFDGHMNDEQVVLAILVSVGAASPVIVAIILVSVLFLFSFLAVWDHPESGWEAVKDSVRIVKDHYWSVLGLVLLFGLIGLAAALAGIIACCVGLFFTVPVVMVWYHAALIYLYRSWTGRPLAQPAAGGGPYGEGPLAPTSIEPPAV
jgi:uncharacterized membrane protein